MQTPNTKKITSQDFEKLQLSFEDLTYETMVRLWCLSDIPDSLIAEKCGVPRGKVTYLRRDKYGIKLQNTLIHLDRVYGADPRRSNV